MPDTGMRVRVLLAKALDKPLDEIAAMPDSTSLFGSGLSLDSLSGLELLTGIKQDFGVDIAAEDMNLDSLETLGTLVAYLEGHRDSPHTSR